MAESPRLHDQSPAMHVACVADANYGAFAGITLSSVLNRNRQTPVHIHLFSDGIRQKDINLLEKMASVHEARLSVYNVAQKLNDHPALRSQFHYSRAAYGRLFMGDLLPPEVEAIIYLDCDVICVDSLHELWALKDNIALLGAVRDPWVDRDRAYKQKLGADESDTYYNSGVLLINIKEWRRRGVVQPLMEVLAVRKGMTYVDQDAINLVLGKDVMELPGRWNTQVSSPDPGELHNLLERASNIHFSAGLKPWHIGYRFLGGSGAAAFRSAKAASPWRWMLPDFQIRRIRRKSRQVLDRYFARTEPSFR